MRFYRVILFVLTVVPFLSSAQNREIDSLQHVISSNVSDTLKLQAYSDLSWIYAQSDYIVSRKYAMDELTLAQKINNKKWIAQAWNDIGIAYSKLNFIDSALNCYNKSLSIRRELNDKSLIGSSLSKIGLMQYNIGNYASALKTQLEALQLFESLGNESKIALTYNNISIIYDKLKNYAKAIEYSEKALALHEKNKEEYQMALDYGNLSAAYRIKKDIKKSNEYLQKALPIFKKYGDISGEANVLNSIGLNFKTQKDSVKALEYYRMAYDLAKKANDKEGIALYGHNISVSLMDLGKYKEAEKYSLEVLKSTEPKNRAQLLISYRALATIYGYINEGKKARHYLNKYTDLKDTLFSKENAAQIAEMEIKYQTEKKNLQLEKNKAELDAKDRRDFIKNLIIIIIVIIFAFIGLLGLSAYKRKQIELKAEAAAELARQKELRSKAIIEAEEKERKRIAQDLHDGVGQTLSAAKLNLSGLEDKLKLENKEQALLLKNALELVNDSVKEVRVVSHNMMPNVLIKLGLASAVREFITKIGSVPNLKIDLQIVGLDERLENTIETVLYRVIQEVVSNIIKHAKANRIGMQLIKHDHELTVMIEDNGVGFDKNDLDKFEGIGLKNIISRVEFLNGRVEFDSTPGQGTTVVVEVPLV